MSQKETSETVSPHVKMMGAATWILSTGKLVKCPVCGNDTLRFYCHVYITAGNIGTMWAWCVSCSHAAHISQIEVPQQYHDPFANLN